LRAHLAGLGIGTDIHYPVPDHLQQAFARAGSSPALPVTEAAAREVLSLPCFPDMTDDEVERVVMACNTWEA
jgi:dTDP-4-amino-4,6-dideoxygalactose transaminase